MPCDFYNLCMLYAKKEYNMNILARAVKNVFANRDGLLL